MNLRNEIIRLPNLPHISVAPGFGAENNVIVREGGMIPVLPGSALPHWELIKKYDIIDFDLGIKLTGCRFSRLQGQRSQAGESLDQFLP